MPQARRETVFAELFVIDDRTIRLIVSHLWIEVDGLVMTPVGGRYGRDGVFGRYQVKEDTMAWTGWTLLGGPLDGGIPAGGQERRWTA